MHVRRGEGYVAQSRHTKDAIVFRQARDAAAAPVFIPFVQPVVKKAVFRKIEASVAAAAVGCIAEKQLAATLCGSIEANFAHEVLIVSTVGTNEGALESTKRPGNRKWISRLAVCPLKSVYIFRIRIKSLSSMKDRQVHLGMVFDGHQRLNVELRHAPVLIDFGEIGQIDQCR